MHGANLYVLEEEGACDPSGVAVRGVAGRGGVGAGSGCCDASVMFAVFIITCCRATHTHTHQGQRGLLGAGQVERHAAFLSSPPRAFCFPRHTFIFHPRRQEK